MITGKDASENKNVISQTYRESLIETINFLESFKKNKLQKVEVKNYLEEMKSNIHFNFKNFKGTYADLKKIRKKEDFLKNYKGKSLADLKEYGITINSPVFELNFQDGKSHIGSSGTFAVDKSLPKDNNFYNAISVFFFGRPKFFTEGLILSDLSEKSVKTNCSDSEKAIYKLVVEKENDKDFFESFYKSLEGYRKRTIDDNIDKLKSDLIELIDSPIFSSSSDNRIYRLQRIQHYFGLELLKV